MDTTLATYVDRIQQNYDETGTENTGEAEIKQWVQEAFDRLATTGYLMAQCKTALTANQENYDLAVATATNAYRIIHLISVSVLHEDGSKWYYLKPMPWHRMERLYDGMEDTGGTWDGTSTPTHFCWRSQYCYLWPVSDYTEANGLRFTFYAAELMDEDTDDDNLPREYESAVTDYGLAQWYAKDRRQDLQNYYTGRFEQKRSKLQGWLDSNRTDYPEMISASGDHRGLQR